MKLIDKDALVAEIERRKHRNILNEGAFEEDIDILSFINTLEVKYLPEEPVSNDLEQAAEKYEEKGKIDSVVSRKKDFINGAKWQKQRSNN